ncbi:hypothetical protein ACHAXN_002042 [Cyclotella atomus]
MWISHGRAFIIRNEDVFASRVMSAYFKQTRFRSFIRQLLLWGFKRILDGVDHGAWYHPQFLRGKPSSLALVKRTAVKSNVPTITSSLPKLDFYAMSPIEIDTPEEAEKALGYDPTRCDSSPLDEDGKKMERCFRNQEEITPTFCGMPPTELDRPDEAMNTLGVNYPPASNGRCGSALDEDDALQQFAAQASKNLLAMTGRAIIPNLRNSSGWLDPMLTMQIPSWISTSPTIVYSYLNQFGHAGYPCIPSGFEGQGGPLLKSEEFNPNGLENQNEELNRPALLRLPTTMPDSNNWSAKGLNASVLETDDLVMKAIQYAFRDMPSRQVQFFKSDPHLITEDHSITSVQLPGNQHSYSSMMQGINQQDCFAFDSYQHQQREHQGGSLPPVEEFSYSTSVDRGISFSSCIDFATSSMNKEDDWNQIIFNSNQQPSALGLYHLEEDDELVQFINDVLADDGEFV